MLTAKEWNGLTVLKDVGKIEYLAGRWSAKEAFSKAMGTGIGKLGFQDLEVLNNERGAPYFSQSPFFRKDLAVYQSYQSVCDSQCHFGGKS